MLQGGLEVDFDATNSIFACNHGVAARKSCLTRYAHERELSVCILATNWVERRCDRAAMGMGRGGLYQ